MAVEPSMKRWFGNQGVHSQLIWPRVRRPGTPELSRRREVARATLQRSVMRSGVSEVFVQLAFARCALAGPDTHNSRT
eukprot:14947873-Alexandrium_andersonii.AAC.1